MSSQNRTLTGTGDCGDREETRKQKAWRRLLRLMHLYELLSPGFLDAQTAGDLAVIGQRGFAAGGPQPDGVSWCVALPVAQLGSRLQLMAAGRRVMDAHTLLHSCQQHCTLLSAKKAEVDSSSVLAYLSAMWRQKRRATRARRGRTRCWMCCWRCCRGRAMRCPPRPCGTLARPSSGRSRLSSPPPVRHPKHRTFQLCNRGTSGSPMAPHFFVLINAPPCWRL